MHDKKFFNLTSFKDFCLEFFDDTHLSHWFSDSQPLSFFLELTPTLTLGLGIAKNVLVYMALIAFKSFIEFVFIFFTFEGFIALWSIIIYVASTTLYKLRRTLPEINPEEPYSI